MMNTAVFIAFVLCICQGMSNEAPNPETTSSRQEIVDTWIAKQLAGAVAVALVSPNSTTQFFFAGTMLPKNPASPDEQTMFEVGSITKGFTGLLLADQVKSGKVSLNDTLAELLTDWPGRFSSAAANVTLLELATHSSGLPRLPGNMDEAYLIQHAANPYASYTKDDLYTWLDNVTSLTPGNYSYSNAGSGILGHVLAVTAGQSYEDLLKERLWRSLGLEDTTITLDESQMDRLAPGHDPSGKAVQQWDFDVLAPCGAVRSSISDLARFLKLATGINESVPSFQDILELATRYWGDTGIGPLTIGLGWHRSMDGALIWHNGATGGSSAFLGWRPEQQIGVAVLASISMGQNNTVDQLAVELLQLML